MIKEGDIITAYHKGIHKVIRIEQRFYTSENEISTSFKNIKKVGDEMNSLVYYKQIMTNDGNLVNTNTIKCCDILFCKSIETYLKDLKNIINLIEDNLKNMDV